MTYQIIPNDTDLISVSQGQIKDNFSLNQTGFDTDHVDFNSPSPGQHKQITLNNIRVNPTLTYPVGMIYSKTMGTAPNLDLELFFAAPRENGAAQINRYLPTVKAYGTYIIGLGPTFTLQTTNYINVNLGAATGPSASAITVNFLSALDYTTYSVFVTTKNGAEFSQIGTTSLGSFTMALLNSALVGSQFTVMVI